MKLSPLLSVLLLVMPGFVVSADFWQVTGGVAHTSIYLPEARKPNTYATLTVEYSIVQGVCRVMVGVSVMTGRSYGTYQARKKVDDVMKVTIPGMREWSAKPVVAVYSNGVEAAIPAGPDFVEDLRAGSVVRVQAMPNMPTFEFSLIGSSHAIRQASTACHGS